MTVTYTTNNKFPQMTGGGKNWGAAINSALDQLDLGYELTEQAGENIAAYEVVYMKSDGKVWLADADVVTTLPALGIAPAAITAEASGKIRTSGVITNGSWSWTIGDVLFVSNTAGGLSASVGVVTQIFGVALTATKILIAPVMVAN